MITAGQSTTYGKAKAIEQYLQAEYTYRFADELDAPPAGRDPVDWFLFESREGTSGSFSSAFVILARLVGVPARVVSGWAIAAGAESQTICSDQAHQWAEVAFDGPGWVAFDPTPGGAPARTVLSCDPAENFRLENGSVVSNHGGQLSFTPGGSAIQSPGLPRIPLFTVTGAGNTNYLRTGVGDVYRGAHWDQLDPVTLPYSAGGSVPDLVRGFHSDETGLFAYLPSHRLEAESLFGLLEYSDSSSHDRIRLSPAGESTGFYAGLIPTSKQLLSAELDGVAYPFSATFSTRAATEEFGWTAEIRSYSDAQLNSAVAAPDSTYTRLPEGVPERVRELAVSITAGHSTTYAKAKAIEQYLKTSYPYRFADSPEDHPPSGRDPVDWFLFDHQEGTCGVFSSAFVCAGPLGRHTGQGGDRLGHHVHRPGADRAYEPGSSVGRGGL